MSDTPKTDAIATAIIYFDVDHAKLANFARDLERENAALRAVADYAETLLCNSLPMPHCQQGEWGELIKKWRDQKHATNADKKEAQP